MCRCGHYGEEKSLLPLWRNEPRFLGRPASSTVPTTRTVHPSVAGPYPRVTTARNYRLKKALRFPGVERVELLRNNAIFLLQNPFSLLPLFP
jgi:hypothetical protein